MRPEMIFYSGLLVEIKICIRTAQSRASLSANAEMIAMYWDIGRMIHQRQQMEGWGTGIIPRLATDLKNQLPEIKGFSERNIGYMIRFAREYEPSPILQQPVAKLESPNNLKEKAPQTRARVLEAKPFSIVQHPVAQIPWGHNILQMARLR